MGAYRDSNMSGQNAQHSPHTRNSLHIHFALRSTANLDALFWAHLLCFRWAFGIAPLSGSFARNCNLVQSEYFRLGCVEPPIAKGIFGCIAKRPAISAPKIMATVCYLIFNDHCCLLVSVVAQASYVRVPPYSKYLAALFSSGRMGLSFTCTWHCTL